MPQSLACLPIHLVFSTRNRNRIITETIRESLHAYMATVFQNLGCHAILINSVEDHVHILFELARTVSVSKAVEEVKTTTSKWMKTQIVEFADFSWQSGYGAFSVSQSNVSAVCKYIANQCTHHRVKSFQEEYLAFLRQHDIAFDERYVWN